MHKAPSCQFVTVAENQGAVSLFTDVGLSGYSAENKALLVLGYFVDDYDVASGAGSVEDGVTLNAFLTKFNPLASATFDNATQPGYLTATDAGVEESGVGKTPYLLLLGGISEWGDAGTASQIGLFTDTCLWGDSSRRFTIACCL